MKTIKKIIIDYSLLSLLSILILILVLQLWKADITVPFSGKIDALFNLITVKTIADTGWYFHNSFLGAPFRFESYDFPTTESFYLVLLRFILLFSDSATALNLFFILSFPLTAIASFFVLKCLKISHSVSLVISLLYTFLPYHFLRGIDHVFLAAYYVVPLITLVILSLWYKAPPFFSQIQEHQGTLRLHILNRKSILCILICIFLGSTGVYYAFFGCIFIIVASISAFLFNKNKRVFLSGIILITLISSSLLVNLLPSIIYNYQYGVNKEVAHRPARESEVFGLKIVHLLFPIGQHRFPVLKKLADKYIQAEPPLQNENTFASLGIVASIGFLSLLFNSVFSLAKAKNISHNIYERLAVLNISAVLFATIGGFSSIFAVLVSPQIRGVNRISIFIAFFSLLAVAIFLDSLYKEYANNKRNKILFNLLLTIVLLVGILDQTSPAFIPQYSVGKNNHLNDKIFVNKIEKVLPTGSMVFQLPHVPFPEYGSLNAMADYDLFRGYLHSKKLRWSYGAMVGRNNNWHQLISEEPLDNLLKKISIVGFSGIYIDRYGYSDYGKQLEMELQEKLATKAIVSENKRLTFFNMQLFNEELRSRYSSEQIETDKWIALNPIKPEWKQGFYALEQSKNEGKWRWSNQQSTLILNNPTSKTRKIQINMELATAWSEKSTLKIESDLLSEVVQVNSKPLPLSKEILLTPGKHIIKFSSDAKQVNTLSQDTRKLFFRIFNLKLREGILEDYKIVPLSPTKLEWKEGFYNPDKILNETWRWSDQRSTLVLNNPTSKNRKTRLSMVLATGWSNDSNLRIESELFSEVVKINSKPLILSKEIELPPGRHDIHFLSDAKQVKAPGDSRKLFFRINEILY